MDDEKTQCAYEWDQYEDPHVPTLCDYPLLIGEVLRRHELRMMRRAKRRAILQKVGHLFGMGDSQNSRS